MIVDRAIYEDGRRAAGCEDLTLADLSAASRRSEGMVWLGLYRPSEEEFERIAAEFDLHELAVEDAVQAHQRPKLERYGHTLYCVLRPAWYVDETETVHFGEVHVFAGDTFVITVRHSEAPDIGVVRHDLEARPDLLARGPVTVLHAIMDRVVDDYAPVIAGIENDVDEIEDEVFDGTADASRRIYELSREVIHFQRAVTPLVAMLNGIVNDASVDTEERRYLRDVLDHALRVQEQADGFRELLQNILNVNLTLETKALSEVSIAQNSDMKQVSGWAAILFAPTLVGAIYGMNFDHMPELHWTYGYPFALLLMVGVGVGLYATFKRRGWL